MRIQATGLLNSFQEMTSIGQVLQVKVLKTTDNSRSGMISLAGQQLDASFETEVKSGDRFLVSVKEVNEDLIVLSKLDNKADLSNLSQKELTLILQRGYRLDPAIGELLDKFVSNLPHWVYLLSPDNLRSSELLARLYELFINTIPDWGKLSGQNYSSIMQYLFFLGLNYEKKLKDRFMSDGDLAQDDKQVSFKAQVLGELNEGKITHEEKAILEKVIEQTTGQQLWAQSGSSKNSYILLHLPLWDQERVYNASIAFESPRRGNKLDPERCHIALKAETSNIGLIGADIWFYERQLDLTILSDNPEYIKQYIQENHSTLKDNFRQSGITLKDIKVCMFRDKPRFDSFISGCPSEVDTMG